MVFWITGALMTTPSSTMATCLSTVAAVRSVNCFCPPPVKVTSTCHWSVPAGSSPAVAPLTSVPTTVAGASRYLALPSRSQATVSSVGLSTLPLPCRFAAWEQSRAAKAPASESVAAPGGGVLASAGAGAEGATAAGVGVVVELLTSAFEGERLPPLQPPTKINPAIPAYEARRHVLMSRPVRNSYTTLSAYLALDRHGVIPG